MGTKLSKGERRIIDPREQKVWVGFDLNKKYGSKMTQNENMVTT